ncbi:MAG: LysR family transcriptional regulator [Clostridiaceae bacterium]|jgi:molybdate transport repressor ModE-like protein|nr:LysR family transcriptional regulator [Clostridiaceae bacterium]
MDDNSQLKSETIPRGAAVIVASKPLVRRDTSEAYLPAMHSAGDVTYIESLIIRFQLAGAMPIVVVTGFGNDLLERHLGKMGTVCLYSPEWSETSIGEDVMQGLEYIEKTCSACDKIWIATPHVPNVEVDTLIRLLGDDSGALIPLFEEQEGEPIVVSRATVSLLAQRLNEGYGRDLIDLMPPDTHRLPVDDPGIKPLFEDEAWASSRVSDDGDIMPFRINQKLILARGKPFFGPGPATLLRLIDQYGNVRSACLRMKLSYSKGWQIINLLEKQLGAEVIARQPGGVEGGSSQLTEKGRALLRAYESLVAASQIQVNALFEQIFTPFLQELRNDLKIKCND